MSTTPKSTVPPKNENSPYAQPSQTAQTLMGFERPNYFCGHLLTDADLSLEQRYFREKTKLYHRSLDGHGIVHGLQLTCDPDRSGGIFIGRGYAIDNCGNDLVLPVRMPFDVVSLLREKGLIADAPPHDWHKPEKAKSEGAFQQCFYVTICYQEDQVEFTTPLVTACQPMLSECEPTRVNETVRFDVVDSLPGAGPDRALKRRLESCFKLFSEGPFGGALKTHQQLLSEIVSPGEESLVVLERHHEYSKLFSELQTLLLLYLKKHPDKYDRTIEDKIRNVDFPAIHAHSEKARDKYSKALKNAFSNLLALAWQHTISSALAECLPPCHEPAQASCVRLGTVMVENGRIVRVCNSSRSYVFSFASFPEVLFATILGDLACEKETEENSEKSDQKNALGAIRCRDFNFDLGCFLQWLNVSQKAPFYAGTEMLRWLENFRKSIQEGFDFTNPCHFSPKIFEGMDENRATEILKAASIQLRTTLAPLETKAPDLFSLTQAAGLATGNEPIVLAVKDSSVTSATLENSELLTHINNLYGQISNLKAHVERLQSARP